jgi:hypothetical protein
LWLLQALPILVLRMERGGKQGNRSRGDPLLPRRLAAFTAGDWSGLWADAMWHAQRDQANKRRPAQGAAESRAPPSQARRQTRARKLVAAGEFSSAVQALEAGAVAPGTEETLEQLRQLHPPSEEDLPDEYWEMAREWGLELDIAEDDVLNAVRRCPKAKAADRWGWRGEYYTAIAHNGDILERLTEVVRRCLRGEIGSGIRDSGIAQAMSGARLVALAKERGGIRPIGVTDVLRRLAGRVLVSVYRDDLAAHFVSPSGRVVQFAVGRPHGSTTCCIATNEHLRLHPDEAVMNGDVKNAFNETMRLAMAAGIAQLKCRGGRAMMAFFLWNYGRTSDLSFFGEDGVRNIIKGESGSTQGCALGTVLFCLATFPLIVEAVEETESVHAYSFSDDTQLCGKLDEVMDTVLVLQRLFGERAGLRFRSWKVLLGPEARRVTAAELTEFGFHGTVEVVGEEAGDGLEMGEPGGGDAGMAVLGGPVSVGDVFPAAYVKTVVVKHKKRLKEITSLGVSDAQSALLLLTYCAVPRLHFLLQLVPLDAARAAFEEGYADILSAYGQIVSISNDELADPFVAARVSLPWKWGGQAIVDPRKVADGAMVSSWLCSAPFLAQTVPALRDIGSELNGDRGPLWGYLKPAWSRVKARGADFDDLVPEFSESTQGEPAKGIQRALSALGYATDFQNLHAEAVARGTTDSRYLVVATAMLSMNGIGALAWHMQIPFAPFAVMATNLVLAIVRFELNLQQPSLTRAISRGTLCYCCSKPYQEHTADHHVLTVAMGNTGGNRVSSHNELVRQAQSMCNQAGLTGGTTTHCAGLMGTDPARGTRHDKDHVGDLAISGLRTGCEFLIADITIVHPVGGSGAAAGKPKPACAADTEGAAVGDAEVRKAAHYGDLAARHGHQIVTLGMETYGRFGLEFLAFIHELAEHATSRVDSLDHVNITGEAAETRASFARRLRLRWMRQISLTRARTIAARLCGASVSAGRKEAAAGSHNIQRGLFQDASVGLPRGV